MVVFRSLVPNPNLNPGNDPAFIHAFLVGKWNREPQNLEGQKGAWFTTAKIRELDVLPNVNMILDAVEND